MTISSTTNRAAYTGNGVTVTFPFPYYFLAAGDLLVVQKVIATGVETTLVLNSDYTVTGVANPAGGNVVATVAPAATVQWSIVRDPAITQTVDLVENDPLPVETAVERPLDRLTMIAQRLRDMIGRAMRQSDGDTSTLATIPSVVARASKVLGFDALGALTTYSSSSAVTDSASVTWLQAGLSAISRTLFAWLREQPVSVGDYGASPTATPAVNLAAFQAAINYCQDNLKQLRIPSNGASLTYPIGGQLSITKPLVMLGDGQRDVYLQFSGLGVGQYGLDVDCTVFGTAEQSEIGGFTIDAGSTSRDCIRLKNISSSRFFDIGFRGSRHGIVYTGTRCFSNRFERLIHVTGMIGTLFAMQSHTGGGQHGFHDCIFGGDTGFSVDSNTITDGIHHYNSNFEQCVTNSCAITGTVDGLGFHGGRTEGGIGLDFQINPAAGKSVRGAVWHGFTFGKSNDGTKNCIQLGGAGGTVRGWEVSGCSVVHATHTYTGTLVLLNGDGESGSVHDNFLDGAIASCLPCSTPLRSGVSVYNNEGKDGKFVDGNAFFVQGTSTPADASGAALVFASPTCRYQKISKRVWGNAQIVYPVTADATNAKINLNVPTVASDVTVRAGAHVEVTDGSIKQTLLVESTTGHIQFYTNDFVTRVTNANLSGRTLYISFSYESAT